MIKTGLIIPVHNRWHSCTQPILRSLKQQGILDNPNIAVLVVDDGSTDGTAEFIKHEFPTVIVLPGDGNLWWGGAIKKGMEYLINSQNEKVMVWLNNDLSLPSDFSLQLTNSITQAYEKSAAIGGIILSDFDQEWIAFSGRLGERPVRYYKDFDDDCISVNLLSGNLVIIPISIIKKVGLPDTLKFPHYSSDYEYTTRIRRSKFPLLLNRNLRALTHYTEEDVIRYMPVWMQWYLSASWSMKLKLLIELRSLKFGHNIWAMVNGIHIDRPRIFWWQYELFYLKKIMQCLFYSLRSKKNIKQLIATYCQEEQIHPLLTQAILQKL